MQTVIVIMFVIIVVAVILWYDNGIHRQQSLAEVYERESRKENSPAKSAANVLSAEIVKREEFESLVSTALDDGGQQGCLLLLDVDQFREINSAYGHDAGDAILENVTKTLCENFRECDRVCRLGEDGFAVWLSELSEASAEPVRRRVAVINDRLLHSKEGFPPVSVSVGGVFSGRSDEYKELYKKAGMALDKVKNGGRCGCAIYGW